MSASSSTASSALTRTRAAILIVASVAAAYSVYYLHSSIYDDSEHTTPSPPLHRSNAIHRRRRRTLTANEVEPMSAETAAENDEDAHIVARPLTDGATVVDDQEYQDDYSWTDVPPAYQRTGQNIVQLLFRVSEDATRRNAYVHRGCGCNSCGVVPIRGIRYRCSNCADFDLCENCEAQGLHTKTHIFYKVKIPAPSFGPKNIQPVWYTGDPDGIQRMLPKEMITKLSNETGFERPELDAYWEQWTFMANTEWREDPDEVCLAMDRKTFERCLVPSTTGSRHAAPSLIYDRMFAFYDTNNDNLISFAEFLHGLAFRKKRDKWRKIFEGYDIDGDGYVDRKDFLRMFRAYYVLYRQMHRDMLEGYDDQVMSSTDAQQLVTGRQPLSSAFGRDGRFPPAPNAHTGVGKAAQPNGELEIIDGKGVINESSNDTGNREDVFARSFGGDESERMLELGRQRRNAFRVRAVAQENHAAVLLNPPETPDQLTRTILNGIAQNSGFETMDDLLDSSQFRVSGHQDDDSEWEDGDNSKVRADDDNDDRWPPSFITDELVEEVLGPGFTLQAEVLKSREIRQAVLAHYVRKQKARREVHERWVRRQFYTDEEEGATPPEGWEDSDDILVRNGMAGGGESSKSQPQSRPLSPRSRSSSKVRFVEDDDYDIRSTTSSTSRSIPERWGGMEIADAEKDAGKEILYQVTQQAFNELLDPIFKSQEDLAESIALTKPERDQYRHLYSTPEFEAWASEKDAKSKPKDRDAKAEFISKITKQVPSSESQMWPGFPGFPENDMEEEIRQRPLDDLLAETGYTIAEEPNEDSDTMPELEDSPDSSTSQQQPVRRAEETINSPLDNSDESAAANVDEIIDTLISQEDNLGNVSESTIKVTEITPITPKEDQYRDPTMPQFRPNSHSTSENSKISPTSTDTPKATEAQSSDLHDWDVPDKDTLWMYWKLDRVAKEAESRGGWGKLNFDEWEKKIKACIRTGKGNSMDYLGSWIEFCIP